jgi:hypothetical protein
MSSMFQTSSPSPGKLDPLKRVNYTFGLVLGVDEFLQEDTYFVAKHNRENRLLHGYGTVRGLDVTAMTSPALEVRVAPGWAINPIGQEIHVPQMMCVQINDWLQANLPALQAVFPGPTPATLNLCVVLCYRECKTDVVPIPGEPCQTQSSSTAPSRIADSFELMLCLDPDLSPPPGSPPSSGGLCEFRPSADESGEITALVNLLSEIQTSETGPFLTLPEVKQLVRDLVPSLASPPLASLPTGPPYYVAAADASRFFQAAVRTWITEVLPVLTASSGVGTVCPPVEKCVLLAEIALSLNANWNVSAVTIDDSRRPFLMSTRLLQELAFKASTALSGGTSYKSVAAGSFQANGAPQGPTYNLTATPAPAPSGAFMLRFEGYLNPTTTPGVGYIVKGTVQDSDATPPAARATFEFVAFQPEGILVRILDSASQPLSATLGFMVEICQIGGAS